MKQILGSIQNISTKKLLPTQVSKLAIFIQIWLLRITNKHEIEHTLSQEPAELDQIRQVVGPDIPQVELDFLAAFLLATDILPNATQKLASSVISVAEELTKTFMQQLLRPPFRFSGQEITDRINAVIEKINIQFFSFYNEPTTFISPSQVDFFQQTYPLFDIVIGRFLQDVDSKEIVKLGRNDQVNL